MRIGIVGDVPAELAAELADSGHQVSRLPCPFDATSALAGLEGLITTDPSSVEVCRKVRDAGGALPVVILAPGFDAEQVRRGFEAGCDDYFVAPFRYDMLLPRLRVLNERTRVLETTLVGRLRISASEKLVVGQQQYRLPGKQLALLRCLAASPNEAVSYTQLISAAWGTERLGSNSLEVHVSRLRRRLVRALGPGELEIRPVRGVGYVLRTCA